jgi:fructokinase
LDKRTAFIGKVGKDAFGRMLRRTLEDLNIDVTYLYEDADAFTTLAFVEIAADGNRSFSFARHNSADVMLSPEEIDPAFLANARIFHCGTLSLTAEPSRSATLKALELARANGVCISVDPNLRMPLWKNAEDAAEAMRTVLRAADIIKISDYEMEFLYGTAEPEVCIARLRAETDPKLIFLTCGKEGAYLWKDGLLLHEPCFDVKTIDTTGAGDSFWGGFLAAFVESGLAPAEVGIDDAAGFARFGNAVASLCVRKRGAIPAMPSREEVLAVLA